MFWRKNIDGLQHENANDKSFVEVEFDSKVQLSLPRQKDRKFVDERSEPFISILTVPF